MHACMNEREEWIEKKWNLPCLLLCCGRAVYVFFGLCFVIDLPVAVRSRMDDAEFVMAEHDDSNRRVEERSFADSNTAEDGSYGIARWSAVVQKFVTPRQLP